MRFKEWLIQERRHKKKKGIKLTFDVEGEPVVIGEQRQKGKPLTDDPKYANTPKVRIYRAVEATVQQIMPMDYVTLSSQWAIQHAQHQVAVNSEPYHVLSALVPTSAVFEAYNPGEYFYDGPAVAGKPVYRVVS